MALCPWLSPGLLLSDVVLRIQSSTPAYNLQANFIEKSCCKVPVRIRVVESGTGTSLARPTVGARRVIAIIWFCHRTAVPLHLSRNYVRIEVGAIPAGQFEGAMLQI